MASPEEQLVKTPRGVEVEVAKEDKEYLGGFQNKETGTQFHNADSQTPRKEKPEQMHRETQASELVDRSQQTLREAGTQMARKDLDISTQGDREVTPRPYIDSEALEETQQGDALTIQCAMRQHLARRNVEEAMNIAISARSQRDAMSDAEADAENAAEDARAASRERPRSAKDFKVMLSDIREWHSVELKRIDDMELSPEERTQLLCQILAQETKLLQGVDKMRVDASRKADEERAVNTLEAMAHDKQWNTGEGPVHVQTEFSQRAQFLLEMYKSIELKMEMSERMELCQTLRRQAQMRGKSSRVAQDLIGLVDRELDLLGRRRPQKSMAGLRKRMAYLFFQLCLDPEFNPESHHFQALPGEIPEAVKMERTSSRGSALNSARLLEEEEARNAAQLPELVPHAAVPGEPEAGEEEEEGPWGGINAPMVICGDVLDSIA